MDRDVSDAVGALYDALLQPALWQDALQGCADLFGAPHAVLAISAARSQRPELNWCGVDPDFQELYGRSFVRDNDPVQLAGRGEWREQPFTDRMVLPAQEFQRTDFYQQWCRPQRIESLLGAEFARSDGGDERQVGLLGLGRPDPFGDAELALYRRLMPDLRRVIGLRLRLMEVDLQRVRLRALLDEIATPILLTDSTGRLQHANTGAVALLSAGDVLQTRHGRLAAGTEQETAVLRDLVCKAGAGKGGSLCCHARGGERVGLLVVPVRADHGWAQGAEHCVAVFVTRAADRAGPLPALLITLYGLTPTEAAVALIVARGDGLPAAAAGLGMRISTARTHLHRIFGKTGTSRQSQLAWLLRSLPHPPLP
jgi:DNA-binding CsgD family transcriptional regulator